MFIYDRIAFNFLTLDMDLSALKKSLHEKVEQSNDLELLKKIHFFLEKREKLFIVPEHMKEGIMQGREDIKNGNFFTMEEMEKKYEKYLKK